MKKHEKQKNEQRILGRRLAKELSMKELEHITGGLANDGGTTSYCGCGCEPDDCDI